MRNCAGKAANSRIGLITRDWADFGRSGVGSGGTGPRPASVATAWLWPKSIPAYETIFLQCALGSVLN